MNPVLSSEDHAQLTRLEESLWIEATRFDESFMQRVLAPDFFEFGKSGKMHTRDAVLRAARDVIGIVLPLRELRIQLLDDDTAQICAWREGDESICGKFERQISHPNILTSGITDNAAKTALRS